MEGRFGHSFSQVRVHADDLAGESARRVGALAYTVGQDIAFAPGQYRPDTSAGMHLLAHELNHVVLQQHTPGHLALWRHPDGETPPSATRCPPATFVPGVEHNHMPDRPWAQWQAELRPRCRSAMWERLTSIPRLPPPGGPLVPSTAAIECACAYLSPENIMRISRDTQMRSYPLAQRHLDHFLHGGGVDYPEDLETVIRTDQGVRAKLAIAVAGSNRGNIRIEQYEYMVQDFRFAFGAIDRLDYEVCGDNLHVWFKDRYEFHPEDTSRPTHCVHVAAVDMKLRGAQDYWMVGEATIPMTVIRAPLRQTQGAA